jgi:hypothetical protein
MNNDKTRSSAATAKRADFIGSPDVSAAAISGAVVRLEHSRAEGYACRLALYTAASGWISTTQPTALT